MKHFSKKSKGLQLLPYVFDVLHRELIRVFLDHYTVEIESYSVFQLYGFDYYDDTQPNLAGYIYATTHVRVNGKYLYNRVRDFKRGKPEIRLTRQYVYVYLRVLGYKNIFEFVKSPHFDEVTRKSQLELCDSSPDSGGHNDYYVGYYLGEDNEIIKTQFTLDKYHNKVEWVLVYREGAEQLSFYTYRGSVEETKMTLSFHFKAEHSTIERDAFISVFWGNRNVVSRPFLLGTYSGFDKNNCPVAGEIVFEQVVSDQEQERSVYSEDVDPVIQDFLVHKRIVSRPLLLQQKNDLNKNSNYAHRLSVYAGTYTGIMMSIRQYEGEKLTLTILPKTNRANLVFSDGREYRGHIQLTYRGLVLSGWFGTTSFPFKVVLMLNVALHERHCLFGTHSSVDKRNYPSAGEVCFVKADHVQDFTNGMMNRLSEGLSGGEVDMLDSVLIHYLLLDHNDESFLAAKATSETSYFTSKKGVFSALQGTYEVYYWDEEGVHILKDLALITGTGVVSVKSSVCLGIGKATVFADGILSIVIHWCGATRSHQHFLLPVCRDGVSIKPMSGVLSTISSSSKPMAQKVVFIKTDHAFESKQQGRYDPKSDFLCSLSATCSVVNDLLHDKPLHVKGA